ncbi:hypothetical protein AAFF_G00416890 [Aldrovandia affinis]|uniref:Uncharacterized protein n=1 Tax=Aldrovandia affinis TaxID=143900 RepID=A0AAD7SB08_9TELE|nr:hypothetical protein AAFF_G00416890 [Aldrovandia affinis]
MWPEHPRRGEESAELESGRSVSESPFHSALRPREEHRSAGHEPVAVNDVRPREGSHRRSAPSLPPPLSRNDGTRPQHLQKRLSMELGKGCPPGPGPSAISRWRQSLTQQILKRRHGSLGRFQVRSLHRSPFWT